ncbi:MAG: geranylgeranyl pyrophosphate synthase [Ignavibacteria bacterium RBG_13_36_8]|nr:MAG: geranylgeranyl pyrophosphate synthase [Ignavibacteria bacterium RBG_13_36_8]
MTNTHFQKFYERELKTIDNKLLRLFNNKLPISLYEPCSYLICTRGKRLRPLLVILSASAVGADYKTVYNAAIAVELFHNFTLVHDDIMDNSNKRRGKATVHVKYDLSTAILTGDILIALAYKSLLHDCNRKCKEVINKFTQGIIEVCEGQSLDKDFETKKKVSIHDYKVMIQKKTASLVEMCCSLGAQLGGGNEIEINSLSNYGRNLGMAFQIQDDMLDIIGDENKFGKKVGSDLIEGKKTYLFLRAMEKAEETDTEILYNVIRNKGIKSTEVNKYRKLYFKLDIFLDAKKEIERYSQNAIKALDDIRDCEAKNMLIWLVGILINRKK